MTHPEPTDRELIKNTREHYAKQHRPLEHMGFGPKISILDLCDRLEAAHEKMDEGFKEAAQMLTWYRNGHAFEVYRVDTWLGKYGKK